ncbi:MAG: hypothetical protein WCW33_04185 [Candidatus Babeliales bacterium]|jgi:hypothetical protein
MDENNAVQAPQQNDHVHAVARMGTIDEVRIEKINERSVKAKTSFRYEQGDAREDGKNTILKTKVRFYDDELTADQKVEIQRATECAVTGAASYEYANVLITQTVNALLENDPKHIIEKLNAIFNALLSLSPQDEIEGMLCTRLVALHDHYMTRLMRVKSTEHINQSEFQINSAIKLMRIYNETLEALSRYRRKGEQRVMVQHVNVNRGGQAIVGGEINHGGGGQEKSKDAAHAN